MGKFIKEEEFLKLAEEKLKENGVIEVVGYTYFTKPCIFKTSLGEFKSSPFYFLKGAKNYRPYYIDKKELLHNLLLTKNKHYKNNEFTLLGEINKLRDRVFVQDKYGILYIDSGNLLKGCKLNILSAVDKTEYFKNKVYEKNEYYRNGEFEIVEYENSRKCIVRDKYGLIEALPSSLLRGCKPTIKSVVDINTYVINRFKEAHKDRFDYSKVNYAGVDKYVTIICSVHGEFQQTPGLHYKSGCKHCKYDENRWTKSFIKNKIKKNGVGILYLLKIFNEEESFLKIGYTTRSIAKRYDRLKTDCGYEYEIIMEYFTVDGEELFNLENELKLKYKEFKYTPKTFFDGSLTETFCISKYCEILKDFENLTS